MVQNPEGDGAIDPMTEAQVKEQEKLLLEFEKDLLKFETYLKEKEEKMALKEKDINDKIQSG